jgi:hypothetical protein
MNMCRRQDSNLKGCICKDKFLKTLFTIPIYLRKEEDYYKDEEKAKRNAIEDARPFNQHFRIMESYKWPPWEFNDIVRYLQIGIDKEGYFRFLLFGIDHAHGYRRIPKYPGGRRNNMMWDLDYKKYFHEDIIMESQGNWLRTDVSERRIKTALRDFFFKMKEKLEKEERFFDIDYWLMIVKCCDIHAFVKGRFSQFREVFDGKEE